MRGALRNFADTAAQIASFDNNIENVIEEFQEING
jgi:hypothetical protein